jgi:glutamine amidotransferase
VSNSIGVIDIGIGNIGSILRILEHVGGDVRVIKSAHDLSKYNKVILPGVGSFDEGIKRLHEHDFFSELKHYVSKHDNWLLGVCLGMHLMCTESEEGELKGLGLVQAKVYKFSNQNLSGIKKIKIPHMGWSDVEVVCKNSVLSESKKQRFYFVHSYYVKPDNRNIMIGQTLHGEYFCSAFQKNNIIGLQFHPEKSHKFGIDLFKKFLRL